MKIEENDVCAKLIKFFDESETKIKNYAIVNRAYIGKISEDTINKKITSQKNSIEISIDDINPKFDEKSKHYDYINDLIKNTLANYKKALVDLSEFYDGKIEQLILRRVELEAELIGTILCEEYLKCKPIKSNTIENEDNLKETLNKTVEATLQLLKCQKNNNNIDLNMISKLKDSQDVAGEFDAKEIKVEDQSEDIDNKKKENKEHMEKIEKEINSINTEIERLNLQKKNSIYDAMEVGDKTLTKTIRKPKAFKKIKRFFVARFNTAKVIETTVIEPLNHRIENFINNELINMK